ncbi:hypothetical protein, partial [Prevotellamassilia timonensis]|uniref:hypothetical protein n=1 Tax=Prevotellamassilia timonensis TaxID=1852370 RepID=UPI0030772D79
FGLASARPTPQGLSGAPFIDGQKVDVTTNGKDVAKEPLVVQVIDSREQVDKQDNEDTDNEDL